MAQTGQPGTPDSLLANVQLAFAGADAALPSITTQSGRLGGQLGSSVLALGGVIGPLVSNVSAGSVLAFAQTANPAPTFAAHASPHWVLGGQDAAPDNTQPAFTGADTPLPALTSQGGRLGGQLGSTVLALSGVAGPLVSSLSAASVLAIAQTAIPAPTFAAHASPRWVLGGQDAYLGGERLAFAGADQPQPTTGTQTGKLGTPTSLLAGMRLALGSQEGGGGATITYVTAASVLAASSNAAVAGVVRGPAASSTLALTGVAGVGCVRGESAASVLALTEAVVAGAVRNVAAAHALDLTDAVTAAAVFVAVAQSAASLTAAADTAAVRTLAAADAIDLTAEAARTASIAVGAESAIEPATAADASAVRAVAAASALDLTDEAVRTSRVIWTLSVESAISLGSALGLCTTLNVGLASPLDLADSATHTALRALAVESAVNPATAASTTAVRPLTAASPFTLTAVAAGCKSATSAAGSALSLGTAASVSVARAVSAASTLAVTQAAVGGVFHETDVSVEDFLFDLDVSADVAVVRSLSAQSALALAQTEQTARPWYLDAETPIQTASYEYDGQTDTFRPVYEGLQDSARAARPLVAGASQAIPLRQSASAVRVKPTAINVSAESVLELLGEIRPSPTGDTGNWLSLAQTAAVDKCKTTKSALALASEATAARSGPRGAASALALGQAVSFSITFAGVRQQYHPFVGEGAAGAPTPPSVTVAPPEHSELPFRLFSPATGTVTDSVTLRAPNLGNKDRLSFNRIVRETRGGTLVVFADPIWPKLETLVLSFSGLHNAQAQQLLVFLETHLGEEIGLLDWEGRCWKGVVMTPTNPVVQDARDSYSASLEFEGELVPA